MFYLVLRSICFSLRPSPATTQVLSLSIHTYIYIYIHINICIDYFLMFLMLSMCTILHVLIYSLFSFWRFVDCLYSEWFFTLSISWFRNFLHDRLTDFQYTDRNISSISRLSETKIFGYSLCAPVPRRWFIALAKLRGASTVHQVSVNAFDQAVSEQLKP